MMRFLKSINLFFLLMLLAAGCSQLKEGVWLHSTKYASGGIPQVFNHNDSLVVYDFFLSAKKQSMEGHILIKSFGVENKRIIMTSFFGMTFFDFELTGRNIKINYCIDQLNKEKLILLLKKDFEIIFKPDHSHITRYLFDTDERIVALEQGNGATSTLIYFSDYDINNYPKTIDLSHPWLKIGLKMNRRDNEEY